MVNMGYKQSEEHRTKISNGNKGKIVSPSTREKIRQKLMGHKHSEQTIIKISEKKRGKKDSERTKKLKSFRLKRDYILGIRNPTMRGKKITDEIKEKISRSLKKAYEEDRKKPIKMFGDKNPFYNKKHTSESIKKIIDANSGEKSHRWNGGKSYQPYDARFNRSFKRMIRKRELFMCIRCGMKEEDHNKIFGRNLDVHHINHNKQESTVENCCALCMRCNLEANFNMESWIIFYQDLLSKRYGYTYLNGVNHE